MPIIISTGEPALAVSMAPACHYTLSLLPPKDLVPGIPAHPLGQPSKIAS